MQKVLMAAMALTVGASFLGTDIAQARGGAVEHAQQQERLKEELRKAREAKGDSGPSFFESLFGSDEQTTVSSDKK